MDVRKMIQSISFILFLALCSCASGGLRVESQPDAADVLLTVSGQPARKIGQTPLVGTDSMIQTKEPFQLTISKEGYTNQNIVVPSSIFSRSTTVQVRLQEAYNTKADPVNVQLQKIATAVAEVQVLMRSKQLDEAERRLTNLIVEFPGVATLHELMGNAQYLRRDLTRALAAYKKASELNPDSNDTRRMIQKIEGIRVPASTGGRQ